MRSSLPALTAAFFTVTLWGFTFVSTKILLVDFMPLQILYLRFGLGWLTLWALRPRLLKVAARKHESLFAGAGLSGVTIYFLLENVALEYTYAYNVAILVTSAPFFTAIFAWKFLKDEKPSAGFFAGFVMALIGVSLVSWNGARLCLNPLGDALAVLAALTWGVYSVLTRKITALGYESVTATRRIFFYGLIFMLPLILVDPGSLSFAALKRPENFLNLFFLGVGASAVCFVTWTYAIKKLGAVKASAWIYLTPAVTAGASAFLLDERFTSAACVGAVLVVGGLLLSEKAPALFSRNPRNVGH